MKNLSLVLLFLIAIVTQVSAQEWLTRIDEAKSKSSETGRPIVLVFQGSDWCAPCIRLDREIWATEEFKTYAKDHYVMLKADFPRKKKNQLPQAQQDANALLAEKYNPQGLFPFIVLLDAQGNVKYKTTYQRLPPQGYINLINDKS